MRSALGAGEIDFRIEREEGGREIAAEGREADAAALRRDVAYGAGGLQTVIIGVAPPFALIVIDAAGVEAEIAADRAHRRDASVPRSDARPAPQPDNACSTSGWRDSSASVTEAPTSMPFASALIARSSATLFISISDLRRDDAAADIDREIGAAAERPAVGMLGACLQRLVERLRAEQVEFAEARPSRASVLLAARRGAPRLLDRLIDAVGRHRQVVVADADGIVRSRW